ncbi:hypothetical protein F2Q69_00048117 [Brassica cretica]|uniref:Uncharacterized protein n=1 Tax=Brassica cretica TaxID=69181 RepID=A0A8S9PT29_BRACR|nr:hypothetical protein F2Q69_00048117 [Brassica cretica]
MKRFSLSYHHKERRQKEKLAGRRSCDVDSRRRRSFDRSVSIKRQGLLEVDELKAISNAKVSNWFSIKLESSVDLLLYNGVLLVFRAEEKTRRGEESKAQRRFRSQC